MQKYTVQNRGIDMVFNGDLLAHKSSKSPVNADAGRWTEFFIYYTDKENFVVDVVSVWADGSRKNRSFVCQNFWEVAECLKHKEYGTLSFTAQKAYNQALILAEQSGLVEPGLYFIDFTSHDVKHNRFGARPGDYDFSED